MCVVTAADDVGAAGRLSSARDVISQGFADVIARQKDECRLMARGHHAEATSL